MECGARAGDCAADVLHHKRAAARREQPGLGHAVPDARVPQHVEVGGAGLGELGGGAEREVVQALLAATVERQTTTLKNWLGPAGAALTIGRGTALRSSSYPWMSFCHSVSSKQPAMGYSQRSSSSCRNLSPPRLPLPTECRPPLVRHLRRASLRLVKGTHYMVKS